MSTTVASTHSLNVFRQQFPALSNKAYFNYGGQGVLPQRSLDAIHHAHLQSQRSGPFSNATNAWITQELEQTRTAIAAELGVAATTIALTEDVSVGCNIALWGVDWREGDHLLLSDCEHPGIVAAAEELRRRFGIKVSYCPLMATLNEGDPVSIIAQHLRPTTRMVVLSHILWNTGQVLPLAAIVSLCHSYATATHPIRVLIDAAQSVGVLPLELESLGVDYYAFTGHKWWCGAAGVGGLHIRPEILSDTHPTFIGWRGVSKNEKGHPTGWLADARRFEIATSDFALWGALREAIATHQAWSNPQERYQRICHLSALLWRGLSALSSVQCLRTTPPQAGLVSFQIRDRAHTHSQFVQALEQQGFLLRTILDPSCIRACVHYFTTEAEIEELVDRISQTLENG